MQMHIKISGLFFSVLFLLAAPSAQAESICDPDGLQASGSIYRICMPPAAEYNGDLIIWAHGFQDAGTPVEIPEDQLNFGGILLNEIVNALGYGFATNSYSKTGLAIVQGRDDILDLVNIYTAEKGAPNRIFVTGASEGGIITSLAGSIRPLVPGIAFQLPGGADKLVVANNLVVSNSSGLYQAPSPLPPEGVADVKRALTEIGALR